MKSRSFYNEILTEHNLRPEYKHDLPDANIVLEGVNPNCGDDIFLKLKVENDVIEDGAFVGDGCAISQASADMMLDLIVGKSEEEAMKLAEIFLRMINLQVLPLICNRQVQRDGSKATFHTTCSGDISQPVNVILFQVSVCTPLSHHLFISFFIIKAKVAFVN